MCLCVLCIYVSEHSRRVVHALLDVYFCPFILLCICVTMCTCTRTCAPLTLSRSIMILWHKGSHLIPHWSHTPLSGGDGERWYEERGWVTESEKDRECQRMIVTYIQRVKKYRPGQSRHFFFVAIPFITTCVQSSVELIDHFNTLNLLCGHGCIKRALYWAKNQTCCQFVPMATPGIAI